MSGPSIQAKSAPGTESGSLAGKFAIGPSIVHLLRRLGTLMALPVPEKLAADPEIARRARMINGFGTLGSLFGLTYAVFYLLVGHSLGAIIILVCTLWVALTPSLMCWKKSVELAGHSMLTVVTLGFFGLCCIEGGLFGHAIAWLVSVPLCALLLVGQKLAGRWAVISFFAAAVVASFSLAGKTMPIEYDPRWAAVISAAGYLGLILFMFILGLIFESGRARAFGKMQEALGDLAASNERLVHLNNEKNEFLGIAAHDLKNPLTVICGSAELLGMTTDPAFVRKLSETIGASTTRMRELIANLLDVNAIEQGKFTSNIERCDLSALVSQSVENNRPNAVRKEISICVGQSEGTWAKADRGATLQILDNLISNAIKYSPKKTSVHINVLPEREHIMAAVRDEGPGISEADQKKLFQKFSRLSARPTAGESSTGLGLAIVKRLAEAMSGNVQCQSSLGAGSTFMLRLPAWPRETSREASVAAAGLARTRLAATPAQIAAPHAAEAPRRSTTPVPTLAESRTTKTESAPTRV
jgi:signal transduction histidine kinase